MTKGLEDRVINSDLWLDNRLSWFEYHGRINHIVDPEDIPGFQKWLFLNGYEDPNPTHRAFDFSAYEIDGGVKHLGLPEGTPIRSPLSGQIDQASRLKEWNPYDENVIWSYYQATIRIAHNCSATLSTTLCHVVPIVKPGQFVEEGEQVGAVFYFPGAEEGPLPHVHVSMRELYPGSVQSRIPGPIDPLKVLSLNEAFREVYPNTILRIPNDSPIQRETLQELGIISPYNSLKYKNISRPN